MSSFGKLSSSPPSSSPAPSTSLSAATVGSLKPLDFLARTEGRGQTSVEYEVWDTAHRLYVYVATCHRATNPERLEFFRRLVRLCFSHRAILLEGVASLPMDDTTTFEACAICRRREYSSESSSPSTRTTGHCCWFRPDSHAWGFLQQLLVLCDNNSELFGDEVSAEEFQRLFVFA